MAACPEPIPGRKEHSGAERNADKEEERISFLEGENELILLMTCFFILCLFFREFNIDETPKRPVRRGRRGSFNGRLNANNPIRPERVNTKRERRKFLSLKIR